MLLQWIVKIINKKRFLENKYNNKNTITNDTLIFPKPVFLFFTEAFFRPQLHLQVNSEESQVSTQIQNIV